MNSEHKQTNDTATTRSHLSHSLVSSLGGGGASPSDPSFVSSLTLTGADYYPHRPMKSAPVSLTTEPCMDNFDEDTLMEFHRDMADMYGMTWEEYFELRMEAHVC